MKKTGLSIPAIILTRAYRKICLENKAKMPDSAARMLKMLSKYPYKQ